MKEFLPWLVQFDRRAQSTQHGCLTTVTSLLGDGGKGIEKVYSKEKKCVLGRLEQPRLNKNLLYRYDKAKEPTKEGPLSFVLFESPFSSVSTFSRGHPSLLSLVVPVQ
jgi:hypothetical protein